MIKRYKDSNYYISDDGQVFSKYNKYDELRELRQTKNKNGYMMVSLSKLGTTFYVHRLVAETFIPNPQNKKQVNHKNLNKLDNSVKNLEWATQEENCRHYRKTALENNGKTSARHGKLFCGLNFIGEFHSLQQAKAYVKDNYHCSLSTIGELNVNYKNRLVFIRNSNPIDISSFGKNKIIIRLNI